MQATGAVGFSWLEHSHGPTEPTKPLIRLRGVGINLLGNEPPECYLQQLQEQIPRVGQQFVCGQTDSLLTTSRKIVSLCFN